MTGPIGENSACIRRIALVVSDFEGGGVERNFANIALGLARLGIETTLLAGDPAHAYLRDLPRRIRVVPIRASAERTASLRAYLEQTQPDLLLTGKLKDDYAAVEARASLTAERARAIRLVAAVGTPLSARFSAHRWNPFKTRREIRSIRECYRNLDGLTAVSDEIAADLKQTFGLGDRPIAVLCNPIVPDNLDDLAAAPCPHPWLDLPEEGGRAPTVLAVGGLRKVKDFPTLLRAFARLSDPQVRLIVLGEGKERARLERLARRLGIIERLALPGFVSNPFPWLARASVVALSSRREGLPNVLVEAMALGTPTVATDCTHGVRKLLQGGRLGELTPIGDDRALASALERMLLASASGALNRHALRRATEPFQLIPAATGYLDFFRALPNARRCPDVP